MAHEKITTGRRKAITYVQFFCNYTPQRDKTFQTRLVPRGNLISFPDYVITRIEDITAQKILFNITISTKGAWFPCCDIKTYLGTPLDRYEYIRLLLKFRPEEIIAQYGLRGIEHNGFIYAEIRKGMYGLPRSDRTENV